MTDSGHPHPLPQQGGSHILHPDGTLERVAFTIQRGDPSHPDTPRAAAAKAEARKAAPAAKEA